MERDVDISEIMQTPEEQVAHFLELKPPKQD